MKEQLKALREHLRRAGLKRTAQREEILRIFLGLEDFQTVDAVARAVREQDPRIGQSTVYRSLKLFVEAGLALEHHFLDGKTCFERPSGPSPRNYLVCTSCQKVQAFEDRLVEAVRDKVCRGLRFAPAFNRMEIYGLCAECRGPLGEDED